MTYDSQKYHRRSIRLTGYDYSQAGAYFVTVCAQDRACLFGEVVGGQMHLNDAGRMVLAEWDTLPDRFPAVELDAFCVMPNHIHGILTISTAGLNTSAGVNGTVGAGLVPALGLAAPAVSASGAPVPGAGVNPGATTRVAPTGIIDTGMIDGASVGVGTIGGATVVGGTIGGATVDVGPAAVAFEQATESAGPVGAGLVPAPVLAAPVVSASGVPVPGAGVNPGATTRVAPTGIIDTGMIDGAAVGVGTIGGVTVDVGPAAVAFEQETESAGPAGAGLVPALVLAAPVVSASGAPVPGAGVNPGATTRVAPTGTVEAVTVERAVMAAPPRLGDIVGAFKSLTTDLYIQGVKQSGWPPFRGRLWQRNYYENIIRSHRSLNHMRQYILDNPAHWASDQENPEAERPKKRTG